MIITANEVKRRGVGVFDDVLKKWDEAIISLRGKNRFVVLDIARYNELREKELELAYDDVMRDYKSGDFKEVNAKEHVENLRENLDVSVN